MARPGLSTNWGLVLIGLALLVLYLAFFTIPMYLPRFVAEPIMPAELFFFFFQPGLYEGPPLLLFIFASVVIIALYIIGLRLWTSPESAEPSLPVVAGFTLLFTLALILSYPAMSNDIFKYAFNGRILALYGANPFLVTPDAFPQDPFLPLVYWQDRLSAYGPLWRWVEASSALPDPTSPLVTILSLKLWSSLFFLADAALVWLILRRSSPRLATFGLLAFAWNPLLLVETAMNGHNDSMLVFFLLLGLWLLEGRYLWVIPALVLSALVKPVALILAPVLGLYLLRAQDSWAGRVKLVLGSGVLSVLIVVLLFLPFWEGPETLAGLARGNDINGSPGALLHLLLLRGGVEQDQAGRIVFGLAGAGFGLLYLGELIGIVRRPRSDPVVSTFYTLFWYLWLASIWFLPWYLLWLMAPAALLPGSPDLLGLGIAFTTLVLVTYPFHNSELVAVPPVFGLLLLLAWKSRRSLFQQTPTLSVQVPAKSVPSLKR